MSEPSNNWDADEEPFTQEVLDIVNIVETIHSCKSACKLVSLIVQSLFVRTSDIVSDRILMMVDYLVFSETWEQNETTTEVTGFACISKAKRPNARVAGVAIYRNSTTTTSAIPHSIRKVCTSRDVELGLSGEYGDSCADEITVMNNLALLICLYISPDTTTKQKKFFLVRNLCMHTRENMPMIVTGNFNIHLLKEKNLEFIDIMKKYLRLELASDPTKATTLGGSCVDLRFTRNILVDTSYTIRIPTRKIVRESIRAERNSSNNGESNQTALFRAIKLFPKS